MLVSIKIGLLAFIFVVTSGSFFHETFRKKPHIVAVAIIFSIVSTFYLGRSIYNDLITDVSASVGVRAKPSEDFISVDGLSLFFDGDSVKVTGMAAGSAAGVAGLRAGDIITRIDNTPILRPSDFVTAERGALARGQRSVEVHFLRDGRGRATLITLRR
ncbi:MULTISPECIES: PDZ domain-containing protein [Phaeobacter]|uniref:PDZ-like protein n=2 Tax=Phaeobacter inhibens TaxID=221822 RepID=A0ABM6REV5_9RHOB|nr:MULTISPECIES: PDZ domain-containing protein [Phaeobacter]AUQ50419.1 PDZ -like protein [Phaeobacter inhibens]AUQ53850.1 PDZ -like protein [Phaeobacter inhibens]AUQ77866.1 PDZ -like protein [Phaeobacter inhibens]AUQ94959.1 PDZ -like protein [Phaeobacter inhibens]AUR15025.1 PDZ -like protein [Phaeobacter inhibens]